jgi:mycothiol synthase
VATLDLPNLRPYRPSDLSLILSEVGEWNRATDGCGYLHPGDVVHNMSNALRGRDLDTHIYLYENPAGRLLALLLLYAAHGGGFDLLVHPNHRGGALEAEMVAWAEKTLAQRMRAETGRVSPIGTEVMDCEIARRDIFLERGYVPAAVPSTIYTTRSLSAPIPESELPQGFVIRSVAGEHEAELVAAVHNGSFTPKWRGSTYVPVMRTPGFAIDRELVVVNPDGRFAAFLVYWLDPVSRSGLFEPVGCHADFQRRGLTKALMYEGMRRMVAAGMQTAIVKHNTDNPPAAALYRSVGFQAQYTMTDFRK